MDFFTRKCSVEPIEAGKRKQRDDDGEDLDSLLDTIADVTEEDLRNLDEVDANDFTTFATAYNEKSDFADGYNDNLNDLSDILVPDAAAREGPAPAAAAGRERGKWQNEKWKADFQRRELLAEKREALERRRLRRQKIARTGKFRTSDESSSSSDEEDSSDDDDDDDDASTATAAAPPPAARGKGYTTAAAAPPTYGPLLPGKGYRGEFVSTPDQGYERVENGFSPKNREESLKAREYMVTHHQRALKRSLSVHLPQSFDHRIDLVCPDVRIDQRNVMMHFSADIEHFVLKKFIQIRRENEGKTPAQTFSDIVHSVLMRTQIVKKNLWVHSATNPNAAAGTSWQDVETKFNAVQHARNFAQDNQVHPKSNGPALYMSAYVDILRAMAYQNLDLEDLNAAWVMTRMKPYMGPRGPGIPTRYIEAFDMKEDRALTDTIKTSIPFMLRQLFSELFALVFRVMHLEPEDYAELAE